MLKLFFRKNLYEGWDYVPYFLIPNTIVNAVVLLLGFLAYSGRSSLGLWIAALFVGCVFVNILNLAWGDCAAKFVSYDKASVKEYFKAIPKAIFDGMFLGILYFILIAAFLIGFAYYFNVVNPNVLDVSIISDIKKCSPGISVLYPARQDPLIGIKLAAADTGLWIQPGMAGMMAGFTFCWIIVVISMALAWFPAVRGALHDNFRKTLKKCFVLFFDNLIVSLVLTVTNFFLGVISIVLAGFAPGFAALTFARSNAFFLLLKKYDYLDELQKQYTDGIPRGVKIPWKEILKEDEEITGHRTAKSFFMPWKADN